MAKIVELIYTTTIRGKGQHKNDPVREVYQWYEKNGTLLFEKDPFEPSETEPEDIK
jgi:hypothetical protein